MADPITAARQAIDGRVREIETELARLREVVATLLEGDRALPTRRRRRASPSRRRRTLAPRGRRREQLLSHLEKSPGAKPSEIAEAIGTTPANVHHILRRAREDKLVRKDRGGGYRLSSAAMTPGSAKPSPNGLS
jgi:DNA-binding transcriptional ArsR family regulator